MQDYLSTWTPAHELTRGGMVKVGKDDHLTPFGMMEAFLVNGDYGPAYWSKLIRDYADAMKGNRQLTWSRKPDLRALARLDAELSDSEVIQTGDSTYYLLAALNDVEWRAILRADIGGLVLDTASTGNLELMYRIIQDAVQSGQSGLTMSEIPATLKSVAGK